VPVVAQQAVCVLVVWFVDPAVRDTGEEDPDFIFFGDLRDDFAGAWVDAGFEGEEMDCAVFRHCCRCGVWETSWSGCVLVANGLRMV
jgi:hypothetical protein